MNEDDLKNAGFRSKRTRDRRPKKSRPLELHEEIFAAYYVHGKVLKIKDPGGVVVVGKSASHFSHDNEQWQVEHPGGRIRFASPKEAAAWIKNNIVGWTKFEIVPRPKDWGES